MSAKKIKKVVQVIETCTTKDNDGNYKIKPLSEIKEAGYDICSFKNVQLWVVEHRDHRMDGPVIFEDKRWVSYENTDRHLLHLENANEIAFQLRIYALVSHFNGQGEGFKGEKLSTLQTKHTALKKMGKWLLAKGYRSFHQLELLPALKLRTMLHEYVTKQVMASSPSNKPRVFKDCFNPTKSLGLISERTYLFLQEVLEEVFPKLDNTLSHPIIPTEIAQNIAAYAKAVVDGCEKRLKDLEQQNKKVIKYLEENVHLYEHKKWKAAELLHYVSNRVGVHTQLLSLHEYFVDLKVAVYIHILLFTGMRFNEALSCLVGCTDKSRLEDEVYLIESLTYKTADTTYLDTWIANKDTYIAISTLKKYITILEERGQVLLQHYAHILPESFVHNVEVGMKEKRLFGLASSAVSISYTKGGRFNTFEVKSPHFKDMFDLTVTDKALEELERLEQNHAQVRGKDRGRLYSLGDHLRLTNHMFRHTFAYFVVANKLGELEDIADQFKHLSLAMTKIYTDKGILSFEEIIDLIDGFESLMTDAIAAELTEQASHESLRGGAGERFNKAARELVIGITDSKLPEAKIITQVHFKDLDEFKRFLAKNIETIRGLPQGYCTAGDSCKINGASVPSGCVYCGSFIVAETHKVHWRAMKKRAQEKLAIIQALPLEKQKDLELFTIAYKKDLRAAEHVLRPVGSKKNCVIIGRE
ncbi:site-specific integrase [Vibrio cholerae]